MKKPEFILKHSYVNIVVNIVFIFMVMFVTPYENIFSGSIPSIVNDSIVIAIDVVAIAIILFVYWRDIINTKKLLNSKEGVPLERKKVMMFWMRGVVPVEIIFSGWYALSILGLLWTNAILFYILVSIIISYAISSYIFFIFIRKRLIAYFKSNGNLPANFEPENKHDKKVEPNRFNRSVWLGKKKSLHMLIIAMVFTASSTAMIALLFAMSYIEDKEDVHFGVVSIISILWSLFPLYVCNSLFKVYTGQQDDFRYNYQPKSKDIKIGLNIYFFLILFFGTMFLPQTPHILNVGEMALTYVSLGSLYYLIIINGQYMANNRFILTSGLVPDHGMQEEEKPTPSE